MTEQTKEQITAKAREFATTYTNRHFPNEPAFVFGNESWAAFCDALVAVQPPQQSAQTDVPEVCFGNIEQPAAWYQSSAELSAIYGEICAINETTRKDQTPVQTERLNVLRSECVAIHYRRITLAAAQPVEPTASEAVLQVGEIPYAPDYCPITGRKFWGNIEHSKLGVVATYGGPFDTFTIPAKTNEGELRSERFDYDHGKWVDSESVGWFYEDQQEPEAQTVQPAEVHRVVRPLFCPKCAGLWLFWPKGVGGAAEDSLNLRSEQSCDFCEHANSTELRDPNADIFSAHGIGSEGGAA